MTPDDLCAAVRASLDRTEDLAKKAASLCGCHPPAPVWWFGRDAQDGRIVIRENPHTDVPRKLTQRWNKTYWDMGAAEHIAHHDPSSVLRRVATDRRVLDRHRPVAATIWRDNTNVQVTVCAWCDLSGDTSEDPPCTVDPVVVWPCPDLRDLTDRSGITTEAGEPDGS